MKLIIGETEYELVEINQPRYVKHGDKDENFDSVYEKGIDFHQYKSIVINGKFYYPRKIES